jgi:hypothetical protein
VSRISIIRDIGDVKPTIDLNWQRDADGYFLGEIKRLAYYFDPRYERDILEPMGEPIPPWEDTEEISYLPPAPEEIAAFEAMRKEQAPGGCLHGLDTATIAPLTWTWIHGKSGKLVPVRPLDDEPALFKKFEAIRSAGEALAFVNRYGLPGEGEWQSVEAVLFKAEQLRNWRVRRSYNMASSEPLLAPNREVHLSDIKVMLGSVSDAGPLAITFSPRSLLDGLKLQMGYAIAEERPPRACRHCGTWFDGRRADAVFCSEEHRRAWYSLERTRKKHRAKPGATPSRSLRSAKASPP